MFKDTALHTVLCQNTDNIQYTDNDYRLHLGPVGIGMVMSAAKKTKCVSLFLHSKIMTSYHCILFFNAAFVCVDVCVCAKVLTHNTLNRLTFT